MPLLSVIALCPAPSEIVTPEIGVLPSLVTRPVIEYVVTMVGVVDGVAVRVGVRVGVTVGVFDRVEVGVPVGGAGR